MNELQRKTENYRARKFAQVFIDSDFDAEKAYELVFKTKGTVREVNRILELPEVENILRRVFEDEMALYLANKHSITRSLVDIAFNDPALIFNDDYTLKPLSEIPESARRTIDAVSISPGKYGDRVNVKLGGKMKALELLGKQLSMFKDQSEVHHNVTITQLLEEIDKGDFIDVKVSSAKVEEEDFLQ